MFLNYSCNCYCFLFFQKKNDLSVGLGKKVKSYATIALLSIFSLGKGRETLIPQSLLKKKKKKNFKILQSALSDQPLQHTSLYLQCVCEAPQNCPILQYFMYILCKFHTFPVTEGNKILHLHFSS